MRKASTKEGVCICAVGNFIDFPEEKRNLQKSGRRKKPTFGYGTLWEVERSFSTTGKGEEFLPIYSSRALQKMER